MALDLLSAQALASGSRTVFGLPIVRIIDIAILNRASFH